MTMRAWTCTAALLLLSPAAAQEKDASSPVLTLPAALALALEQSPRLEAARAGIPGARALRDQVAALGRPTADLSAAARAQGPRVELDLPRGFQGRRILENEVLNPSRVFDPAASVRVPVYTGGRVSAGKRAAGHAERAAEARVAAEAQRLVLDVTEAYLDSLEALQYSRLAGSLRELNEERLAVARVRVNAGAAIPLELGQVEADLAQAVQREIEAKSRVRFAGATLNTLIGRPALAPLTLAALPETLPPTPLPDPKTATPSPERVRELGLDRPDLEILREEVRRAEAQIDVARAERRPLAAITGDAVRRFPETLFGGFIWQLGLSVVHSLFDGGRARARVNAARAERSRATAVLKEAERRTEEQVAQALVLLDAAEKRLRAEELRTESAEEVLEIARQRFKVGAAAPIEVTEAETVLTRAQTEAVTARFELARARARLAYATGVAYPDSLAPEAAPASGKK